MRILITGANGFIGKSICKMFEKKNAEIIKIVSQKKYKSNTNSKESTYYIDISDKQSFVESKVAYIKDIDALIHTAGLAHQFGNVTKEHFWKVNVEGTKNVAKLALDLNAKHFIQISSVSVYGDIQEKDTDQPIYENTKLNPTEIYAQSKLEAENFCRDIFKTNNIKLTILRLATVIGEGDAGNVLRLIEAIDKNRFIWVGKGKNIKSLIYIEDVARAMDFILSKDLKQEQIYNLTAKPISMNKIVSVIAESLDKNIFPIRIPFYLLKNLILATNRLIHSAKLSKLQKSLAKWVTNDFYSGDKIYDQIGFKPEFTIEEALRREINWYQNQK